MKDNNTCAFLTTLIYRNPMNVQKKMKKQIITLSEKKTKEQIKGFETYWKTKMKKKLPVVSKYDFKTTTKKICSPSYIGIINGIAFEIQKK